MRLKFLILLIMSYGIAGQNKILFEEGNLERSRLSDIGHKKLNSIIKIGKKDIFRFTDLDASILNEDSIKIELSEGEVVCFLRSDKSDIKTWRGKSKYGGSISIVNNGGRLYGFVFYKGKDFRMFPFEGNKYVLSEYETDFICGND